MSNKPKASLDDALSVLGISDAAPPAAAPQSRTPPQRPAEVNDQALALAMAKGHQEIKRLLRLLLAAVTAGVLLYALNSAVAEWRYRRDRAEAREALQRIQAMPQAGYSSGFSTRR